MSDNVVAFSAKGRASAASGTALSSASRIEPLRVSPVPASIADADTRSAIYEALIWRAFK